MLYNINMKNIIIVFVLSILVFAGCTMDPPVLGQNVQFTVVSNSSGSALPSMRSVSGPQLTLVEGGLVASFHSPDIELWSTEWVESSMHYVRHNDHDSTDPLFNIFSTSIYDDLNQSDSRSYPQIWESWDRGVTASNIRGQQRFEFESGSVNAVPSVDVIVGQTLYDVVRISISEVKYNHNGTVITQVNNPLTGQPESFYGDAPFDSIFLISDLRVTEPYFIHSDDFTMTYSEIETKHGSFYADFITYNKNHVIMDGAIFIPFDGIDLNDQNVDEVVINLIWDVDNSIDLTDSVYTYENRVGGFPFDFQIAADVY